TQFLTALFQDALGRPIDATGQATFSQALANGMTRGQVADLIFASGEYRQRLVNGFFQQFLGRAADPTGLNGFVNALQAGSTDLDVIAAIEGSPEAFNRAQAG